MLLFDICKFLRVYLRILCVLRQLGANGGNDEATKEVIIKLRKRDLDCGGDGDD